MGKKEHEAGIVMQQKPSCIISCFEMCVVFHVATIISCASRVANVVYCAYICAGARNLDTCMQVIT